MILGLLLALVSALATNVAFLFKHRGAVLAPPIQARHPARSAAGLFRSKWFAVGWMVAIVAWALHVGALALAPLSIVQAVLSGGLVFLAVLGERFFGLELGRWQWLGVTITAAGLVVIGLTDGGAARPQRSSLAALIAVECAIFGVGAALVAVSAHRRVLHRAEALLLGLAGGALFGVSDVAIKYLTHAEGPLLGLVSPWTLTALVAGAIAFYASARSLQLGPGVEVIALTSVAANLVAIIGGILAGTLRGGRSPPRDQARRSSSPASCSSSAPRRALEAGASRVAARRGWRLGLRRGSRAPPRPPQAPRRRSLRARGRGRHGRGAAARARAGASGRERLDPRRARRPTAPHQRVRQR
jgi:drug/metabolite transporter (DMT)-like permease